MRRANEEDPERVGTAVEWEKCPVCNGRAQHGQACQHCQGMGVVERKGELPPEGLEEYGEFLRAWSMIEKYGLADWMLAAGVRHPTDRFMAALGYFNGELDRLEHEERRAHAIEAARKRKG